jgi:hypothetical protein
MPANVQIEGDHVAPPIMGGKPYRRGYTRIRKNGLPSRKTGRPPRRPDDAAQTCFKLRLLGASNEQIADAYGVSLETLERWKRTSTEFGCAWERGGILADAEVAYALYRRATGYANRVTKVMWNSATKSAELVDFVENIPPDERAAGRWLNNRRKDLWAERIEHDHQGTIKLSALIGIALEARVAQTVQAAGKQIEAVAAPKNGQKDGLGPGDAAKPEETGQS